MARDIKTLLSKKKTWSGEEVARASIASWLYEYEQAKAGKIYTTPLFTEAELQSHLNSITDPAQGRRYNNLISIREWAGRAYLSSLAQEQQCQLYFSKLFNRVTNIEAVEDTYRYLSELPAIMTEKQYKELIKEKTETALHPDGEQIGFSVFGLLQEAIDYYVKALSKNPRDKKNPLQPLKKKLEAELVTDPHILTRYNKVMGNGYYTLPDGRASKDMTEEEWEEAVSPVLYAIDHNEELTDFERRQLKDQIAEKRILAQEELVFSGMTDEEAQAVRMEADYKEGFFTKCEWHEDEDTPEDLNKWEILEAGELGEYYPTLYGEEGEGDEEEIEAFRKEFPEVVAILLKDMQDKYSLDTVSLIKASSKEWVEWGVIFWEDLYKMDFYHFKKTYIDTDTNYFNGNRRALFNGVALLRPSDLLNKSRCIDEDGNYIQPQLPNTFIELSIEALFTDSEYYASVSEDVMLERQYLLDSYYYLQGYNKAIDIIIELFDFPEFEVVKARTDYLAKRIEALNGLFLMLYRKIKNIDYEDEELKQKKLEVLKDFFYKLDYEKETPPEDKVEYATRLIKDFSAFKDKTVEFITALCYKDPDEDTEEEGELKW